MSLLMELVPASHRRSDAWLVWTMFDFCLRASRLQLAQELSIGELWQTCLLYGVPRDQSR